MNDRVSRTSEPCSNQTFTETELGERIIDIVTAYQLTSGEWERGVSLQNKQTEIAVC